MAFPEKTKVLKRPIGWEDLGEVEKATIVEDGITVYITDTHSLCKSRAHIGKENGELFKFCPRCLVR